MSLEKPPSVGNTVNWLVIGSGFGALSFLGSLQSRDVFWIDLTSQDGSAGLVEFEVQEGGCFSPYAANRNACVGGGLANWGTVVTSLATGGFEGEHDNDREWLTALAAASEVAPNTLWRDVFGSQRTTERQPVTPREFSQAVDPKGLRRAQMTYVRRPKLKRVLDLVRESGRDLHVGRFISVLRNRGDRFELRYLDTSGDTRTIEAYNLVLASGTFLNCCLLFELTGQFVYPLANHVGTVAARVTLKRPTHFKHFVQRFQGSKDSFAVWFDNQKPQLCSVRLVPDDGRSLDLINSEGGVFVGDGIKKSYQYIYHRLLRTCNFYKSFLVQLMLETRIGTTNYVRVQESSNSEARWKVSVDVKIDENLLELGAEIVNRLTNVLKEVSSTKTVEYASWMRTVKGGFSNAVSDFLDAAHYFGSVPCSSAAGDSRFLSVDSSLRLQGHRGIWVLGNCVLPNAGCGHPTELISQLAFASGKKAASLTQ